MYSSTESTGAEATRDAAPRRRTSEVIEPNNIADRCRANLLIQEKIKVICKRNGNSDEFEDVMECR